jgi:hypothetical protein
MSTVRRLLDQIENYRLPTLQESSKTPDPIGIGASSQDPFSSVGKPLDSADPLAFLQNEKASSQLTSAPPLGGDPFSSTSNQTNLFAGIGK